MSGAWNGVGGRWAGIDAIVEGAGPVDAGALDRLEALRAGGGDWMRLLAHPGVDDGVARQVAERVCDGRYGAPTAVLVEPFVLMAARRRVRAIDAEMLRRMGAPPLDGDLDTVLAEIEAAGGARWRGMDMTLRLVAAASDGDPRLARIVVERLGPGGDLYGPQVAAHPQLDERGWLRIYGDGPARELVAAATGRMLEWPNLAVVVGHLAEREPAHLEPLLVADRRGVVGEMLARLDPSRQARLLATGSRALRLALLRGLGHPATP